VIVREVGMRSNDGVFCSTGSGVGVGRFFQRFERSRGKVEQ
jgi:hypothetical protein